MFEIINNRPGLIEIKSKYHFWCLLQVEGTETYFLYHKHEINHPYHRQLERPVTFNYAKKLILKHDEYVSKL